MRKSAAQRFSQNAKATLSTHLTVGFTMGVLEVWYRRGGVQTMYQDMAAAGVTWVRLNVYIQDVYALSSNYPNNPDWTVPDINITAARAAGLNVLIVLSSNTYPYFYPYMCSDGYTYDAAVWTNLAAKAAAHYGPLGIHCYELMNEPNVSSISGWGDLTGAPSFVDPVNHTNTDSRMHPTATLTGTTRAAAYVAILQSVYTTLHTTDSQAHVLAGSAANVGYISAGSNFVLGPDWIQSIYTAGGAGYCDAISIHPYTYPNQPPNGTNPRVGSAYLYPMLSTIRQTMIANGDGHKSIWITEYGAPTMFDGMYVGLVTEGEQATQIGLSMAYNKTLPYLGPLFFFTWQDTAFALPVTSCTQTGGAVDTTLSTSASYNQINATAAVSMPVGASVYLPLSTAAATWQTLTVTSTVTNSTIIPVTAFTPSAAVVCGAVNWAFSGVTFGSTVTRVNDGSFGILHADGSKKPAYYTLASGITAP